MLNVSSLSHHNGERFALQKISFRIEEREKVALLGLHGSGKSLLLQILAGYIIPHEGMIHIRGSDLRYDAQEAKRHFGYVPSHPTIHPDWQVAETFQFFSAVRDMPFPSHTAKDIAERWDLADVLQKPMRELHHGQKMRVLFALATLHFPDLILLDDPFQGLDPKELHSIIRNLNNNYNKSSLFMACNKIEYLPPWLTRVLVLDNGQLVLDQKFTGLSALRETLADLWKDPYEHSTKSLDTLPT